MKTDWSEEYTKLQESWGLSEDAGIADEAIKNTEIVELMTDHLSKFIPRVIRVADEPLDLDEILKDLGTYITMPENQKMVQFYLKKAKIENHQELLDSADFLEKLASIVSNNLGPAVEKAIKIENEKRESIKQEIERYNKKSDKEKKALANQSIENWYNEKPGNYRGD